jgi:plastocyanin
MRLLPVLLALCLPIALVACGGGGSGGSSSGGATASACPKGALVVHMRNIRFEPETATASVGQKVCWRNDDGVQHDAVADSGQFKSPLFGQGQTFTTKLTKAGTISYACTVHPAMTAKLDVKP